MAWLSLSNSSGLKDLNEFVSLFPMAAFHGLPTSEKIETLNPPRVLKMYSE